MVERLPPTDDTLSEILKAAGEPTRRAILTLLAQHGPAPVTEIATRFQQSLNAISRHIMVLERAGLVRRRTVWRTHMIEIDLSPLADIDTWFAGLRSIWALRLGALATLLDQETNDDSDHDGRADPDSRAKLSRSAGPRL
ncbi:MAG: metalloregulator ArsR/SmtB family transcription factor [Paracoccaceae bacterium]|jgi:DNA-binding transcriptional ArsR family regulator